MAVLDLKSADQCRFDMVALGEILLRLDPGEGRVRLRGNLTRGKVAANTMWRAVCAAVLD